MVTLSFILSSATSMPKVKLSPDEGSEEAIENLDDELVVKTRIFDSEGASSDEEVYATTIGMGSLPLLFPLLFSSLYCVMYTFPYYKYHHVPCRH